MARASAARRGEGGYALLAVLWITVGVSALTFVITAAARGAIAPSRNRIALTVASWSAAACLAHARAVLAEALARDPARAGDNVARAWDHVARTVSASPPPMELGCALEARPVGSRLDVNASDRATLVQLFQNVGMPASRADSIATTVVMHKPYVDVRELHQIPGPELATALDSVLDVEHGGIALNHAPGPVLALLPGFTEETVERLLEARARDAPISSFHELSQLLSPDAPEASARLPGLVTFQPTAWVITVRARAGTPAVTAVVQARVAGSGGGTSTVRRRSWIE